MGSWRSVVARARHAAEYPLLYRDAFRVRGQLRDLPDGIGHDETVELARELAWRGGRLRPTQSTEEITWLLERVAQLRPRTIVEIGTDEGGTLFLWTRVAAPDALLVGVDIRPLGVLGRYSAWAIVRRGLARSGQRIELVMPVDSQSPATVERVRGLTGERPVDFLFIDADHGYESVKRDFELWSPLVRPGGLVAFHDVKPDYPGGTPRYWAELRERFATEERIAAEEPSYGIGLLHVP